MLTDVQDNITNYKGKIVSKGLFVTDQVLIDTKNDSLRHIPSVPVLSREGDNDLLGDDGLVILGAGESPSASVDC